MRLSLVALFISLALASPSKLRHGDPDPGSLNAESDSDPSEGDNAPTFGGDSGNEGDTDRREDGSDSESSDGEGIIGQAESGAGRFESKVEDDDQASSVILDDGQASSVILDDDQASSVILDDGQASSVTLDDGQAPLVTLDDGQDGYQESVTLNSLDDDKEEKRSDSAHTPQETHLQVVPSGRVCYFKNPKIRPLAIAATVVVGAACCYFISTDAASAAAETIGNLVGSAADTIGLKAAFQFCLKNGADVLCKASDGQCSLIQ